MSNEATASDLDVEPPMAEEQHTSDPDPEQSQAQEAGAPPEPTHESQPEPEPEPEQVSTQASDPHLEPAAAPTTEGGGGGLEEETYESGGGADPELERMMTVKMVTEEDGRTLIQVDDDVGLPKAADEASPAKAAEEVTPAKSKAETKPIPSTKPSVTKTGSSKPRSTSAVKKPKKEAASIPPDYLPSSPMVFVRPAVGNGGGRDSRLHLKLREPDTTAPDYSGARPKVDSSRGGEKRGQGERPATSSGTRTLTEDYGWGTGVKPTHFLSKQELVRSVERLSKPVWAPEKVQVTTTRPYTASVPGQFNASEFGRTFAPHLYDTGMKRMSNEDLKIMVDRLYKVKEVPKLGPYKPKRVVFKYNSHTSQLEAVQVPIVRKDPDQYTADILRQYEDSKRKSEAIQAELAEKYLKPLCVPKRYTTAEERELLYRKVQALSEGGRTRDVD